MNEIYSTIKLRPTRIGFLVRPGDIKSIRKIMRACVCVWGGQLNPIIPVFKMPPKEWKAESFNKIKGLGVAKGYVDFFEPDVYVESEKGLLEEIGLGALRREHNLFPKILGLNEFLSQKYNHDWAEPTFGLSIIDVYRRLFETETRFKKKKDDLFAVVTPRKTDVLVEAIFGAFPKQLDVAYIAEGYSEAFTAKKCSATPDTWVQVFIEGAKTPLKITNYGIELERYWYNNPIIFIFDPTKGPDLIDLWNLRLEPSPVIPVPIDWLQNLSPYLKDILIKEYRPVKGNTHGVMHRATVEFSRSLCGDKNNIDAFIQLMGQLPKNVLAIKTFRNSIWEPAINDYFQKNKRLTGAASQKRISITLSEENGPHAKFQTLSPDFASPYGGSEFRWVNSLMLSETHRESIATAIPFNTFNRSWPKTVVSDEQLIIGSEGFVIGQKFTDWTQSVPLLPMELAVTSYLQTKNIKAELSDPGRIAKQMLIHLGGIWGAYLLADMKTLDLLNSMANSIRRRANEEGALEEIFDGRSASAQIWNAHIESRKSQNSFPKITLENFTSKNIIRLGIQTECPHCLNKNWSSLSEVDYDLKCERCLKPYNFPQTQINKAHNRWYYRVIGPFSVPDYGRGSYSTLLTLRAIKSIGFQTDLTFSMSLNLSFDSKQVEADFIGFYRNSQHDFHTDPDLIVGETKSFGASDLIKDKDITKLKLIAKKLPTAYFVISVLRETFTTNEKVLIKNFIAWMEKQNKSKSDQNRVILLTGAELFLNFSIDATWSKLSGIHKKHSDNRNSSSLNGLSIATQEIYLATTTQKILKLPKARNSSNK